MCDLRANERPKKLHLMAQTDKYPDGHGDSMTESAQRGRFSENGGKCDLFRINFRLPRYCKQFRAVYPLETDIETGKHMSRKQKGRQIYQYTFSLQLT